MSNIPLIITGINPYYHKICLISLQLWNQLVSTMHRISLNIPSIMESTCYYTMKYPPIYPFNIKSTC